MYKNWEQKRSEFTHWLLYLYLVRSKHVKDGSLAQINLCVISKPMFYVDQQARTLFEIEEF